MEHVGRIEDGPEDRSHGRTAGRGAAASLIVFVGAVALIAGAAGTSRYLATSSATPTQPATPATIVASPSGVSYGPAEPSPPIPDQTSDLPLIPWVDIEVPTATETAFVKPTTPTVPMCGPGDLGVGYVTSADDAEVVHLVLGRLQFVDFGRQAADPTGGCYLWGTPGVRIEQAGDTVPLGRLHGPSGTTATPVVLTTQGMATLDIGFTSPCQPDISRPMTIEVQLPSGSIYIEMEGRDRSAETVCDGQADPSAAIDVGPFVAVEEPSPLVATLELPPAGRGGEPIAFGVLLMNTSDVPYSLQPCPSYFIHLYGSGITTSHLEQRLLNCDAIGTEIPPNGTVHMSMVYTIPVDTPGEASSSSGPCHPPPRQVRSRSRWVEARPTVGRRLQPTPPHRPPFGRHLRAPTAPRLRTFVT